MDIQLTLWCSKCRGPVVKADNVYCEHCFDAKDEELQELEDRIKELENELLKLQEG